MNKTAECSCGKLQATCSGEPVRISVCHCLDCQKRTGSSFGVQARFAEEHVTITGPSNQYVRISDSGNKAIFSFCPNCGSKVFYRLEAFPGFVAIAVGNFADPSFPAPKFSVYESRCHSWVKIEGEDIERWD